MNGGCASTSWTGRCRSPRSTSRGPRARELLRRAGLADPPTFLAHVARGRRRRPCHVMRLSFTGEASWELHHPVDRSVELWRSLLSLGEEFGIRPHGLKALFGLRLEKGHMIVGMDTELDTTPRRVGMAWAARMDKPFFIGARRSSGPPRSPTSGGSTASRWTARRRSRATPIFVDGGSSATCRAAGRRRSSSRTVMLGWLKRRPFPDRVRDRRPRGGGHVDPVLRPGGHRARA